VRAFGERYTVRGRIERISADSVDIHHERIAAIKGFSGKVAPMDSMTMPFARAQTSFAGLAVSDPVAIEFTAHYDASPTLRLTRIEKLPADTALDLN